MRTSGVSRRVVLGTLICAGMVLAHGCGDGDGSDEGGTLAGRWSGSITCEGDLAYQMAFSLDGEGGVSDVDLQSNFRYSACPGGPATITCGGGGSYTYARSGMRFHMDVEYEGCRCGGVSVNILTRDTFDGSFDGSGALSGDVGCRFTFRR